MDFMDRVQDTPKQEQQDKDLAIPHKIDVTRTDIKRELLLLPEIIYNLRGTLNTQNQKLYECVMDYDIAKAEIGNQVLNAVDSKGKKKFTNVQQRDFETKNRLKSDVKSIALANNVKSQRQEIDITKRDIDFVINRFKSIRILAPLLLGLDPEKEDVN